MEYTGCISMQWTLPAATLQIPRVPDKSLPNAQWRPDQRIKMDLCHDSVLIHCISLVLHTCAPQATTEHRAASVESRASVESFDCLFPFRFARPHFCFSLDIWLRSRADAIAKRFRRSGNFGCLESEWRELMSRLLNVGPPVRVMFSLRSP